MTQKTIEIGTMKAVPMTEIWKNEAADFTPWLADNIELLGNAIDMDLDVIETEKPSGPFRVDIYAEDRNGDTVVIENQLGKTDHSHLGQIQTYCKGLNSKTAVWITSDARPEHAAVIDDINGTGRLNFYLIEISVIQIGDSKPAIIFKVVCEPNETVKAIDDEERRRQLRKETCKVFWAGLKKIDDDTDRMFTTVHSSGSYLETSRGNNHFSWADSVNMKDNSVLLYFYDNEKLYERLSKHQQEIDEAFGTPLEWHNKEKIKSCKIVSRSTGGIRDKNDWIKIQHDMVDRMSKLKTIIDPYLEETTDGMRD